MFGWWLRFYKVLQYRNYDKPTSGTGILPLQSDGPNQHRKQRRLVWGVKGTKWVGNSSNTFYIILLAHSIAGTIDGITQHMDTSVLTLDAYTSMWSS